METMTPKELKDIKKRLNKASFLPKEIVGGSAGWILYSDGSKYRGNSGDSRQDMEEADFYANAYKDMNALIDEIHRLECIIGMITVNALTYSQKTISKRKVRSKK